jgi:hypothetical protein
MKKLMRAAMRGLIWVLLRLRFLLFSFLGLGGADMYVSAETSDKEES